VALLGVNVTTRELHHKPHHTQHPRVTFLQGDALTIDLSPYDFGLVSPPCQPFTTLMGIRGNGSKELRLIDATRRRFEDNGLPFAIENVVGAHAELRNPIGLCGTMFGLKVARHRLFETSFRCQHRHTLTCDHVGRCL
jgi:DNA (cytosine-5)-methyltransferase 1